MMFKGFRFVHAPKVVFFNPAPGETNVTFLRECKPSAKGAVLTTWTRAGEPIFAKPIPMKGYSRTNMAYGTDGKVYLAYGGACYSTFIKSTFERMLERCEKNARIRQAAGIIP